MSSWRNNAVAMRLAAAVAFALGVLIYALPADARERRAPSESETPGRPSSDGATPDSGSNVVAPDSGSDSATPDSATPDGAGSRHAGPGAARCLPQLMSAIFSPEGNASVLCGDLADAIELVAGVAPICLGEAASGIAPPPIENTSGACIEAIPARGGAGWAKLELRLPGEQPLGTPELHLLHALVPTPILRTAGAQISALLRRHHQDAGPDGRARLLFRPPQH